MAVADRLRDPVEPPSRYPVVVAGDEVVDYLGDLGLQGLFGVPAYPRHVGVRARRVFTAGDQHLSAGHRPRLA